MSDDGDALRTLAAISGGDAAVTIRHYLYLPASEVATSVAGRLRTQGFEAEPRLGADGINWLVIARHVIVPTAELIQETRQLIEGLVEDLGGEYDGWEAELDESAH